MKSYKEASNDHKNARKAKDPESDKSAKPSKKKDTRKWCKGKKGVEHKKKCVDYRTTKGIVTNWPGVWANNSLFKDWKVLICTECGKELAHWTGKMPWETKSRPVPDWVTFDKE